MNDARAVAHGYVVIADDEVRGGNGVSGGNALYLLRRFTEQRLVTEPFPFFTRFPFDYFVFFEEFAGKRFGKYIACAVGFYFYVGLVGIHTQRDVGRQCPGRRRPGEDISVFASAHLKARDGGIFLYELVALSDLVRGKRRSAPRAVGHYLVSLVQKTLFVHAFKRPPLGLDIIVVVCDVRVVHIDPVSHAVGHLFPFALVLPYRLFTLFYEGLYAVLLYLLFAVQPERFFHFELDGQSVGVPARLS